VKCLIAAQYAGVAEQIEFVNVQMGVDNRTPEFLAKFPLGKVPALETPEGPIFESDAILRYITGLNTSKNLFGATGYQQAVTQQWLDFVANELEPFVLMLLLPHFNITTFNEAVYTKAKEGVFKAFAILETHLKTNTFLNGNLTVADFAFVTVAKFLYTHILNSVVQAEYPSVKRYFLTVANQPWVAKVMGAVAVTVDEKAAPGQKVVKPKVVVAPKVVEEKKKNPLDLLPPATVRLDDVKRSFFSERPFNPNFFPGFWETFDFEGYSFWTLEYMYPEDWDHDYVADNLVSGFISRCEATRKYSFGVLSVRGEEGKFSGSGVIIFRGKDIIDEMKDVTDYDEYKFAPLDVSTAEGKKIFESNFCDNVVNGEEVKFRRWLK
jgi:elongation factor 1-gamma